MQNTPHNATSNRSTIDIRGISIVEILVGVVLIGIAVAIAIPNMFEAQIRSQVTRATAEMRQLQIGIEAYRATEGKYPPCDDPETYNDNTDFPQTWQHRLTTPTAYLEKPYLDHCSVDGKHPYFYQMLDQFQRGTELSEAKESGKLYLFASPGPSRILYMLKFEEGDTHNNVIYDASISPKHAGDILHFGP